MGPSWSGPPETEHLIRLPFTDQMGDPVEISVSMVDDKAFLDDAGAIGHYTPTLIEDIDPQLKGDGVTTLVPTDHDNWDLARRMAFLKFAVSHFDWIDHDLDNAWWRADGRSWQEIVEEHPLVFTEESGSE